MLLENYLRNKLQETEEMQDYSVAKDTVKRWIDEYNTVNKTVLPNVSVSDCIYKTKCSLGYDCHRDKSNCNDFEAS